MALVRTNPGNPDRDGGPLSTMSAMTWSADEVLGAVRSELSRSRSTPFWSFEGADLDGDRVLVVFRVERAPRHPMVGNLHGRFGVHYSLENMPEGPNTGLPS